MNGQPLVFEYPNLTWEEQAALRDFILTAADEMIANGEVTVEEFSGRGSVYTLTDAGRALLAEADSHVKGCESDTAY
jgi:DNA-binding transcriptional regulator PaaX